jgi:hypothetical protein
MRLVSAIRLLKCHGIKVEQTLIFRSPQVVHVNREPVIVLELGTEK